MIGKLNCNLELCYLATPHSLFIVNQGTIYTPVAFKHFISAWHSGLFHSKPTVFDCFQKV